MITKARGYGRSDTLHGEYADTVPTEPAALAEYILGTTIRGSARCTSGPCRQGRDICPTPAACRVHAELDSERGDDPRDGADGIARGVFIWPLAIVLTILAVALALHLASLVRLG